MKKCVRYLLVATLVLFTAAAEARSATCPPAEMIKAARFTKALAYDPQINLWEFISVPFMHEGVIWNVAYGMELPGVADPTLAIKRGQSAYEHARLVITSPEPDPIPGHLFCDYTVSGMDYWIQALSPPGE
mgnify:CR=1 FL=1|tara:strand:+ start:838 stop:1230 length:393 start_codon:yes stop_codon:yes gene_type:complete